MISTSYVGSGFKELLLGLIKIYKPKTIVELGTQQGASAILMAKAQKEGSVYSYDLFQKRYSKPPYNLTRSDLAATKKNIAAAGLENRITICQKDALQSHKDFKRVDMLHVDLCNYYENVHAVLTKWYTKVKKLIILEGGGFNKWQREKGFKPFSEILEQSFIRDNYDTIVIKKNDNYALTILIRK